jgi:hypothetical protein
LYYSSLAWAFLFWAFCLDFRSRASIATVFEPAKIVATAVHKVIATNFQSPQYHLLNNLTMPFQDGTTQIDHILISTKGIFVIETKNYSGWIFGDDKSKQWMQVIHRVKSRFQNPVHQNYRHVKAIEQLFDFLPTEQIHSIVVFTGSGEFKTPIPKGVV